MRAIIFCDDAAVSKMLKKTLGQRKFEAIIYDHIDVCPVASGTVCVCEKSERCADVVIMGRHVGSASGLVAIQKQTLGRCKLVQENKLLISSIFDEKLDYDAKELGVKVMYLPFAMKDLILWLDECRKR